MKDFKLKIKKYILILLCAQISTFALCDSNLIKSTNTNISYQGRVCYLENGYVQFDLSGIVIETRFEGASCQIILNEITKEGNRYAIYIDNNKPLILVANSITEKYTIAKKLSEGIHDLRIVKLTEAIYNVVTFKGFVLDNNCKLRKSKKVYSKKIEFIGNSITCGYGVEGDSPKCKFSASTENFEKSFAGLTAKYFNADYRTFAGSGYGIVRNYGDSVTSSEKPLPYHYNKTCFSSNDFNYSFSDWIPDVVILKLGNNDCSTAPRPSKSEFVGAYLNFITRIRKNYGNVQIVCITGPRTQEPAYKFVKNAVRNWQENFDKNISYLEISSEILKFPEDFGCDHHPNKQGQNKIMKIVVPTIEAIMGW